MFIFWSSTIFFLLTIFTIVFIIGIGGIFLFKKNIIIVLMALELMLLATILNFILFSFYLSNIVGQIFALFIITIAAAESAIGLAILVVYFRIKGLVSTNYINTLKG